MNMFQKCLMKIHLKNGDPKAPNPPPKTGPGNNPGVREPLLKRQDFK